MKKENWYPDQPIFKEDLERAQSTKEDSIRNRLLDLCSVGVLEDSQLSLEPQALNILDAGAGKITITTGTAFSPVGERIIIDSLISYNAANVTTTTDNGIGGTTLTPQSSGSVNISTLVDGTNYVWLGYLQTIDPAVFTLSKFTSERLFVNSNDGFEIQTNLTGTNPDPTRFILIGTVVLSGGLVTTITTTNSIVSQSTSTTVPASGPFTITLSFIPKSIPTISGFTYSTTVGPNAFTVDFATGVLTFDISNASASIVVVYDREIVNRQFGRIQPKRAATNIEVVARPSTYRIGIGATFKDHSNARGTGIITPFNPHALTAADLGIIGIEELGAILNDSGIVSPTPGTTLSALFPVITISQTDYANLITFKALGDGEYINIEGTVVSNADIPYDVDFRFVDSGGVPLAEGTYSFFVRKDTKVIDKVFGAAIPDPNRFYLASVYWTITNLGLHDASIIYATDLRLFGTTSSSNLRMELLDGLTFGAATGNRSYTLYNASITGNQPAVESAGFVKYIGIGGTSLSVTVDGGAPVVYTFPALPADQPIDSVTSLINTNVSDILAVRVSQGLIGTSISDTTPSTDLSAHTTPGTFVVNLNDDGVQTVSVTTTLLTTGSLIAAAIQTAVRTLTAATLAKQGAYDNFTAVYDTGVYTFTSGISGVGSSVIVTDGIGLNNIAADLKIGVANGGTEAVGGDIIKLLTKTSLSIDANNTVLGFINGTTDSGLLREIVVSGDSATIGKPLTATGLADTEIILTYDTFSRISSVTTRTGNKVLSSTFTYDATDNIVSITESIA